jgi:hypothetical protein
LISVNSSAEALSFAFSFWRLQSSSISSGAHLTSDALIAFLEGDPNLELI